VHSRVLPSFFTKIMPEITVTEEHAANGDVTFTISPSIDASDRKFMRSHSRQHSREIPVGKLEASPNVFLGTLRESLLEGLDDVPENVYDIQPSFQSLHHKLSEISDYMANVDFLNPGDPPRNAVSNSVFSNRSFRSRMSDVSFSTAAGDMNFDIEHIEERTGADFPTTENSVDLHNAHKKDPTQDTVLSQKFEEVGQLLDHVTPEERCELTEELFSTLELLIKKYDGDSKGMKRVRSQPMLDNLFPSIPCEACKPRAYTAIGLFNDDDVLHCGYLSKRGDWMPQYRKRFVVLLNSGHLRYYIDASCIEKRGEVNFLKCLRVDFEGQYFSIHGNDVVWRFYCDNENKIERWKEAFQQAFKLSQQGCSVNLCEGTVVKRDGHWGTWKKRFLTLDDRGKIRIFKSKESSLVEDTINTKGLEWEYYHTHWTAFPSGMRTKVNGRPMAIAFPHIDKRTIFERELQRADELCGYAPSVAAHW